MSEALRLAHELILAMRDTDAEHWDTLEEAAAELRRLHAALAEPEQNPFGDDAERYARKLREWRESDKAIFTERKPQTTHWEGCEAVHPECRKQEPDGISWLKRDSGYFTAPTPRRPLTEKEIIEHFEAEVDTGLLSSFADGVRFAERAHGIGEQQ